MTFNSGTRGIKGGSETKFDLDLNPVECRGPFLGWNGEAHSFKWDYDTSLKHKI